jgi:hypothetical protein
VGHHPIREPTFTKLFESISSPVTNVNVFIPWQTVAVTELSFAQSADTEIILVTSAASKNNVTSAASKNNKSFVQMEDYFFEGSLATSAIRRIPDLERTDFAERRMEKTLIDPAKIQSAISTIIYSSRSEILSVFPYAK